MNNSLTATPSGDLQIAKNSSISETKQEPPCQLSLVLPTYKEGNNIQEIVKILSQLLNRQIPGEYELID